MSTRIEDYGIIGNTYMSFSSDGVRWTIKSNTFYYNITRGQTAMSELLWAGNNNGCMALRSGELWQTIDGGLHWTIAHDAEDTTGNSIYRDRTGSMMSDSAFGQTTIMLGSGADAYIVLRDGKEIAGPLRLEGSQKNWKDDVR